MAYANYNNKNNNGSSNNKKESTNKMLNAQGKCLAKWQLGWAIILPFILSEYGKTLLLAIHCNCNCDMC